MERGLKSLSVNVAILAGFFLVLTAGAWAQSTRTTECVLDDKIPGTRRCFEEGVRRTEGRRYDQSERLQMLKGFDKHYDNIYVLPAACSEIRVDSVKQRIECQFLRNPRDPSSKRTAYYGFDGLPIQTLRLGIFGTRNDSNSMDMCVLAGSDPQHKAKLVMGGVSYLIWRNPAEDQRQSFAQDCHLELERHLDGKGSTDCGLPRLDDRQGCSSWYVTHEQLVCSRKQFEAADPTRPEPLNQGGTLETSRKFLLTQLSRECNPPSNKTAPKAGHRSPPPARNHTGKAD